MARRIDTTLKEYPWLIAEEDGRTIGYAYAASFHHREAYKHSAEVSIYLDRDCRGKGYGKQLYEELDKRLLRQRVYVLYACVTATDRENDPNLTGASLRFHQRMGYQQTGYHRLCGYKFGKWYSVVWLEKVIGERPEHPEPFVPFTLLR
jgi:phosphinothricin acetyltransferase